MSQLLDRTARDAAWVMIRDGLAEIDDRGGVFGGERHVDLGVDRPPRSHHGTSVLALRHVAGFGALAIAGGGALPGADTLVRIWTDDLRQEIAVLLCHSRGVHDIAVDPRTGFVATASEDFTCCIANIERNEVRLVIDDPEVPVVKNHVRFAPDSSFLAIGEALAFGECSCSLFAISLLDGRELFRHRLPRDEDWKVDGLAVHGDSTAVVAALSTYYGSDAVLRWFDVRTGATIRESPLGTEITGGLAYVDDDVLCATVSGQIDGDSAWGVATFDARDGTPIAEHVNLGIGGCYALTPDRRRIIVARPDRDVVELDAADLTVTRTIAQSHDEAWCALDVRPDGTAVVAGDRVGRLYSFAL